jgi:hypothetical protein
LKNDQKKYGLHEPLIQVVNGGQTLPQAPQLLLSMLTSVHVPLHACNPVLQQVPLEHVCPVEHA